MDRWIKSKPDAYPIIFTYYENPLLKQYELNRLFSDTDSKTPCIFCKTLCNKRYCVMHIKKQD